VVDVMEQRSALTYQMERISAPSTAIRRQFRTGRVSDLIRMTAAVSCLAGVFACGISSAQAYSFHRGPYQQGLEKTRVDIRWQGDEEIGGTVFVWQDPAKKLEFKTDIAAKFHSVRIRDLKPGTLYHYQVVAGEQKSVEGSFTTAPDNNNAFTFLLYGDNRSDDRTHAAVVRKLLEEPSDFIIQTGDMVATGGDDRLWEQFFHVENPLLLHRCMFAAIGNHEMVGGGENFFLRYFHPGVSGRAEPHLYYSFRWSNTRFFVLNAFAAWQDAEDRGWLKQELANADHEEGLEHRIVVMHHGPTSSGPHGPNVPLQRRKILEIMRDHHVELVLAGHDHLYERGEFQGVKYLISGGGGAPLYSPHEKLRPGTMVVEAAYHYVKIRIEGSAIATTARRLDGSVMEECHWKKGEAFSCKGDVASSKRPAPKASSSGSPSAKKSCDCALGAADPPAAGWLAWAVGLMAWATRRRRRELAKA
jgi:acid phosphatase type 7